MEVDSHEAGITAPLPHVDIKPLVVDLRSRPGTHCFYFYQNTRKQIVFCYTPDPPIGGYDTNETSHFLPIMSERMLELLPECGDWEVRRVWRGLYANTKDGNPHVGYDR